MYKNATLRLFQDIYIRRETYHDRNNYYCGLFTSFQDAKAQLELMEKKTNAELKIVVFFNGHKLDEEGQGQLEESYPDLQEYKMSLQKTDQN